MSAERFRAGPTRVFGVEPGEIISQDIPEAQKARLLASGAIEKAGGRPPARKVARSDTDEQHEAEVRRQDAIKANLADPEAPTAPTPSRFRLGGPSNSKE